MLTVVAFIVALGLLIAVHEYGHYRVAVACGVKVLRFSVGFGKPLLRWQPKGSPTEFVLGAFPLGGFVRMLDEREAPVPPEERHLAFNTQPLRSRALIVAAGPVANLVLAVFLYASVNWIGVKEPEPVLASPVAASLAERAGLRGGEWVQFAGFADQDVDAVVLQRRVQDLLDHRAQAVDLVDEEHVVALQVAEDRRQVLGFLQHRARGLAQVHAQLVGDHVAQRGLAQARGAEDEHVVHGLGPPLGGLDGDLELLAHRLLAQVVVQPLGPDAGLGQVVFAGGAGGDDAGVFHGRDYGR